MCYVVSVSAFGDLIWLVVWVISFGHGSWWCLFLFVIWCLCMGFVGLGVCGSVLLVWLATQGGLLWWLPVACLWWIASVVYYCLDCVVWFRVFCVVWLLGLYNIVFCVSGLVVGAVWRALWVVGFVLSGGF